MQNADELLEQSRELALEQAALVGAAGSARPLEKGEDLKTSQIAEADHWVAVYRELVGFSRDLLREMGRRGSEEGEKASEDVPGTRVVLEIQLELHELHLRYWQRHREELGPHDTGDGS